MSRSTLRAALDALETAGAVHRVRGRSGGIFVSERRVERDLTSLTSLPAYLRRQGFQSGARVLSTATVGADAETAAALDLPEGALVLEVVRVRLADEQPISLERARFPADRFPGLLDRSLSGSLYELLETGYGLRPSEAEERVEVVGATAAEARVLEVRAGAPLVAIARTAWSEDGAPVRALERPLPRRPRPHRRRACARATRRRWEARSRWWREHCRRARLALRRAPARYLPGRRARLAGDGVGHAAGRPLLEVVMASSGERGAYPLLRLTFGGGLV